MPTSASLDAAVRCFQVLFVEQQQILVREKRRSVSSHARNMVYDKQTELERPEVSRWPSVSFGLFSKLAT